MKTLLPGAIALVAFLGLMAPVPVNAMGEGDTTSTTTTCPKGKVWDKKKKACVKATSGVLPDEDLYQQGRSLALAGHYDDALAVLALVTNQADPRVLNYTGYANRKAGRFEVAFSYYQKALAIDPNFVLAREYLGEGYVAQGRVDLAKAQLVEIAARCGTTCEEYQELSQNIAASD
ncbi:tetratricopeptide repeat protein [soil metagenome]